jgi:hypothetical protein
VNSVTELEVGAAPVVLLLGMEDGDFELIIEEGKFTLLG